MAARGQQAGPIQFYYTGFDKIIKNLTSLDAQIQKPDVPSLVRGAADVWEENYSGEGFAVRGWRRLSEFTQAIREWRGYREAHPIMEQSGGLKQAAVEYPKGFKGKTMHRTTAPTPMSDGSPTTITIRTTSNRAILKISGSKVQNQLGGTVKGTGWAKTYDHRLPARRFWFVNADVRDRMRKSVMESLKSELDIFK